MINTMQEKSLHAALKDWYARPDDRVEVPVDGYIIDVVRGDLLIEIQTRSFSSIKSKLVALLASHPVRLVYPIARDKWIVRVTADGKQLSRHKSPKRGRLVDLFDELVSFPELLAHPHFEIEVLFIQADEIWCDDGKGSWRRKRWSIHDRHLLAVVDHVLLAAPDDLRSLLPAGLPRPFTNRDLARALELTYRLAQKMTYCLREMGAIEATERKRKGILYQLSG